MEIFIAENYEEMSRQSASDVFKLARSFNEPLLCTASGDTPAGLYKELVNMVKEAEQDISNWNFIGLDEWKGMNGKDEGSCRFYLDQQLFAPLKIPGNKTCFFDGRAVDLEKECDNVETFIQQHNGIDIAVLGLGANGHIGMNEPGSLRGLNSHITAIDPMTQKTGQKYFKEPTQLSHGITLGLGTIMNAKNIFLLVSGKHKAAIVKRMLEEDISEQLPAGILREHSSLKIYLDGDAASLISAL